MVCKNKKASMSKVHVNFQVDNKITLYTINNPVYPKKYPKIDILKGFWSLISNGVGTE
jgi:hypothetical protein